MSLVKFNEEQFLGKQELSRNQQFLTTDGFFRDRINEASTFGIIKNPNDSGFMNFKVEAGTNANTLKIAQTSYAIDNSGNYIVKEAEDNIALPGSGWWWMKIFHAYSPLEEGTVSVDAFGNVVGVNTSFSSILRGYPNFPVKIRFYDANGDVSVDNPY